MRAYLVLMLEIKQLEIEANNLKEEFERRSNDIRQRAKKIKDELTTQSHAWSAGYFERPKK